MKNYSAKTLEELLQEAAADKGCTVEELHYYVTDEKKGLLGLGNSVSADVYSMDDVKEFLFDYLGNFFTGIDQDIEVAIEQTDTGFVVNLNAENNAVLIGKMGKTLAAFNTVVRGAVNSEFKSRVDVLIDINHYKEERYAKLAGMAKRLAKQVLRTKVDVELDPMPNDERKVIHRTLNDWKDIKTQSEGDGNRRHICIRYAGEVDEVAADDIPDMSLEDAGEDEVLHADEFINESIN